MEGGAALEEVKAQSTSGSWSTALSTGSSELSDAENSGNDLTRPLNSIELRLRYLSSASPGSTTEKEYAFLRATTKFDLDGSWKVSLYGETEGVDKQTSSFKSGSSQDAGLYDSMFQAVLIHSFSDEWAVGAGARAVAPTASDNLGSGKWQIMPGFSSAILFSILGRMIFLCLRCAMP